MPLVHDCPSPVSIVISLLNDYSIKNREGGMSLPPGITSCTGSGSCCSSGLSGWQSTNGEPKTFSTSQVDDKPYSYSDLDCTMMIVGDIAITFGNFNTRAQHDYVQLWSCPNAHSAQGECTQHKNFSGGNWVKDDLDYDTNQECCFATINRPLEVAGCADDDSATARCPVLSDQNDPPSTLPSGSYASSTGFLMLTWKFEAWSAFNAMQNGGTDVTEPVNAGTGVPYLHTVTLMSAGFTASLHTTKWDGYSWKYSSSTTGDTKNDSMWREAHSQTAWEYGSYTPRWKSYLHRTSDPSDVQTEALEYETLLGPRVNEHFFPRSSGLEAPRAAQGTIDIMLLPLQSSCAFGNITRDHLHFSDAHGAGGEPGNALWTDDLVRDPVDTSLLLPGEYLPNKTLHPHNRHLTMFAAATTETNRDYIFSFQIINPVMSQNSPPVAIVSQGICIENVDMDKDEGRPCCTTCTPNGEAWDADASPLQIMDTYFCSKIISQSTAVPCALNTLTVTMTANVGMLAGQSMITVTGLNRADYESGSIALLDGSGGANQHLFFGSNFSASGGSGLWDDSLDSLTLFVVKDMDAAAEYVIQFQLYNPPNAQVAQEPRIEASFCGNSRMIFVNGKGIERRMMNYPPDSAETVHPLKVLEAEFYDISVGNSSTFPCDHNKISISFKVNLPMLVRCKPILTFEGFVKAWAQTSHPDFASVGAMSTYQFVALSGPHAHLFAPVAVDDETITTDSLAVYHRYSQDIHAKTPGALTTKSDDVIDYDEDARVGNVSSYTAQRQYLAQFGLRNNLLGISGVNCTNGSWFNATSNTTINCTNVSMAIVPGYWTHFNGHGSWSNVDKKMKLFVNRSLSADEAYTFSFVVVNPAQGQSANNISVRSVGVPIAKVKAGVAMEVVNTEFDMKNIGQSTPWGCNLNTITLTLASNVPLFSTCDPSITLSNLQGTLTLDTPQLDLNFSHSSDVCSVNGAVKGIWTQSTGTVVVNLTQVLQAANMTFATDFSFSFQVVNQEQGQASPNVTLTHHIANSANDGSQAARTLAQDFDADATMGTVVFLEEEAVAPIVVEAGDAKPLFIRAASFSTRFIRQSSPYPCDNANIITVSLVMSVPLLTQFCNHTLTIAGLGPNFHMVDETEISLNENGFVGTDIFGTDSVYTQANTYHSGFGLRTDMEGISGINCTNGSWYNTTSNTTINCTNVSHTTDPGYFTHYYAHTGKWRNGTVNVKITSAPLIAGKLYVMAFRVHNPNKAKVDAFESMTVNANPVMQTAEGFNESAYTENVLDTLTLTAQTFFNATGKDLRPQYIRDISYEMKMVNQVSIDTCLIHTY